MKHEIIKKVPEDLMAALGCPFCNGPLAEDDGNSMILLVCQACMLAFPVNEGIPDLMPKSARPHLS